MGGTQAEFPITAVRNNNDTPAAEGLQEAPPEMCEPTLAGATAFADRKVQTKQRGEMARSCPRPSRDDVGRELVLDMGNAVAQVQSPLFQPLHLDPVKA